MQLKAETAVGLFILAALGVLVYMSFQIGSLRFATHQYAKYCVYSHDISGLNKKADVRIAGVKVGWIDQVVFEEESQRVRICIMVLKKYHLYIDAYAAIRQNGVLGGKYLEIIPGDSRLQKVAAGSTLEQPAEDSVSIDVVLKKMSSIAGNIEEVTLSLKETFGGADGVATIQEIMNGFIQVTEKVASCAESIDRVVNANQENMGDTIADLREVMGHVKENIPHLQEKINQIAHAVDRDFNRVATQIESITPSLGKVLDSYVKHKGLVIKHKFRLF
ncbi:MAG: MlaD family protein [Candidatus Babeliaceae bacterium]|nr:MlaD family protein [Candidatus Babeliaceae bacterium]